MAHRDPTVTAAVRKYLQGRPEVPSGVLRLEEPAYVFLYGAGHELFQSWVRSHSSEALASARDCLEAASTDFKLLGNSVLQSLHATILLELGAVCSCQGDQQRALAVLQQSLRLAEEHKYAPGVTGALNNLGLVYDQLGDAQKARDSYAESLRRQEAERSPGAEDLAATRWNLGRLELKLRREEQALPLIRAALEGFRKQGSPHIEPCSRDLARAEAALRARGSRL